MKNTWQKNKIYKGAKKPPFNGKEDQCNVTFGSKVVNYF